MKKFIILAALSMPLLTRAATTIWASVAADATITSEEGVTVLVSEYMDGNGLTPNAARISVADGGSLAERFLDLYYEDESGWTTYDGTEGVDLAPDSTLSYQAFDFGGVGGSSSVNFELGYYDYSTGSFTALARATSTASELVADGHVSTGDIPVPSVTPWSPFNFNVVEPVPEPTATALLALGVAAMALRRRGFVGGGR